MASSGIGRNTYWSILTSPFSQYSLLASPTHCWLGVHDLYLKGPEPPICYGIGNAPPALSIGLALEQKGDKEGACAAYASVLDRLGNAKPRSVTAEKAKAHAKALGCPERKLAAAPRVPPGLPD